MPQRKRVTIDVTTRKALVRHVEEGVDVALPDDVTHLPPLLGLRVDSGRVVSARVEHDDGALGDFLQRSKRRLYF